MKNKSLFIYLGAVVIIIAAILVFNNVGEQETTQLTQEQSANMPDDDIHKGLDGQMPSSGNVRSDFMDRFNELKNKFAENPEDTVVAKEFGLILSQAHRKPQAIEVFNKIIDKDPARTDILLMLGYEYYEMKDYDKAEDMTKRVLKYQQNNSQAKYNLGAINLANGNEEEAKKMWNEVIEKHPGTEAAKYARNSLQALEGGNQQEL